MHAPLPLPLPSSFIPRMASINSDSGVDSDGGRLRPLVVKTEYIYLHLEFSFGI